MRCGREDCWLCRAAGEAQLNWTDSPECGEQIGDKRDVESDEQNRTEAVKSFRLRWSSVKGE